MKTWRGQDRIALTLDMMRPVVLERVNLYFDYTAVTRLRIVQA
jgi:hypothetical protein